MAEAETLEEALASVIITHRAALLALFAEMEPAARERVVRALDSLSTSQRQQESSLNRLIGDQIDLLTKSIKSESS